MLEIQLADEPRAGASALNQWLQIAIAVAVFVPLEMLRPAYPGQRRFRRHWLNDVVFLLGNGFFVRAGYALLFALFLPGFSRLLPDGLTGFVVSQPLWVQLPAAIIIGDIGMYAAHRMFHAVPFLWRFHAVHHSIEELDWLAAHRTHPLDQAISSGLSILPLLALGFSEAAMASYGLVYLLQSHLLHANVRLPFGPFARLVASPHFHHWHHANVPGSHDKNFSAQLTFMDWIFGTLHLPEALPARYGTDDDVPQIYPLQLLWPLTRERAAATPTTLEAK